MAFGGGSRLTPAHEPPAFFLVAFWETCLRIPIGRLHPASAPRRHTNSRSNVHIFRDPKPGGQDSVLRSELCMRRHVIGPLASFKPQSAPIEYRCSLVGEPQGRVRRLQFEPDCGPLDHPSLAVEDSHHHGLQRAKWLPAGLHGGRNQRLSPVNARSATRLDRLPSHRSG